MSLNKENLQVKIEATLKRDVALASFDKGGDLVDPKDKVSVNVFFSPEHNQFKTVKVYYEPQKGETSSYERKTEEKFWEREKQADMEKYLSDIVK